MLQLRSSNRSDMSFENYLEFFSMRLKSKLTSVLSVKLKAMLLATSLCWLCIWREFICLLSHVQDFSWMCSLKHYSIRCSYHFNVGNLQTERPERDQTDQRLFAFYKARRVGELRMSTESPLLPPPLWLSSPSVRESSSGHANVNTDR